MPDKKINYKDTLNLPKTGFPMKANLQQKEPEIQKKWENINLYDQIKKKSKGRNKYIFHDGPPYANGPIHLGHLLNKVLKDIVVRSKTMSGHEVEFIPGWDCHGLPIEHKVLVELGDKAKDMVDIQIRNRCQSYAEKYVKLQSKQMQRLGTIGEYSNPYLTMSPQYEAGVLEVFAELVSNGLVYRDLKPVHWSIENKTALADAELEYYDIKDKSIYVLFRISDPDKLPSGLNAPREKDINLIIWTTTPWTLPANLAVAVSPNGIYNLYEFTDGGEKKFVIIVDNLAEKVFSKAEAINYNKIGSCKGIELKETGVEYSHPFIERTNKVVTADYVTFEDGTGLVHTAPGHGVEDYQTGLKEGLEIYCPVREDGTFDDSVPLWLQGQSVWNGNILIVQDLINNGFLFYQEEYVHSYPHDWRSKTPTIFRATEQWFIGVDKKIQKFEKSLRELALDAVEREVEFVPEWGKNRLRGMIESRPDWCISRQRSWGLPIPGFTDTKGKTLLTKKTIECIADKIRERGSNYWFKATVSELLEGYNPDEDIDAPAWLKDIDDISKLNKGMDIFDVWFESGSSWHSVLQNRNIGFPADLYLEGSDQHRGWFQLSLLPSLGVTGQSPFKELLTHGFMVDAEGKKMSKSGGNALEVEELLKKNGADICRWWVSSLKFTNDIKVDWEFFKVAGDEYRKVRNTIRFLLGNLYDFDPDNGSYEFSYQDRTSLDAWALNELNLFMKNTLDAYNSHQYKRANEIIFGFCYETLSAIYLAAVKDRLYCENVDSTRRRRTQTVMYKIADSLIRLVAPILVHTSEEAYQSLYSTSISEIKKSVHIQEFPLIKSIDYDPNWEYAITLRSKALKALEDAKENKIINNPLDTGIRVSLESIEYEKVIAFEHEMADLCGVSQFNIIKSDSFEIHVINLTNEPKCERSWKRDGTVSMRSDGGMLSERDAKALGVA